ncbi:MAG: hypothetical protein ABSG45_03150 [Nitrososphaerales archaeon]|jgi:hypothetical protein
MKCYVHQDTDAIGVCSMCGKGVCNVCVVKLGGKFYCKDDADRVFGRRLTARARSGAPQRSAVVMAGSLLAYLLGGLAVVLSFFVLFAGILSGDLGSNDIFSSLFRPYVDFLGPILNYTQGTIIFIGIGVMVFGCIGMAAGFYLWRPAVGGALIAIAFGILGLVVGFGLNSITTNMDLVDAWFAVNVLVIALGLIGLRELMLNPAR